MPRPKTKQEPASPYDPPRAMLRSDLPAGVDPDGERRAAPPPRYAFLRAMRWVMRGVAVLYLLSGLFAVASMAGWFDGGPSGRDDERGVVYRDSQPPRTEPALLHWTLAVSLASTVVLSAVILALGEMIQLGLDIRAAQHDPA